jgi:hypothetical protein
MSTPTTTTITDQVTEKKELLAKHLLKIKEHWPYAEKSYWCITNDISTDRVNRTYLSGSVSSIPVAEKMIEAIEAYMKLKGITV